MSPSFAKSTVTIPGSGPLIRIVQGEVGPGARYALYVPKVWNGDVVYYSHGIRDTDSPIDLRDQDYFYPTRDLLGAQDFLTSHLLGSPIDPSSLAFQTLVDSLCGPINFQSRFANSLRNRCDTSQHPRHAGGDARRTGTGTHAVPNLCRAASRGVSSVSSVLASVSFLAGFLLPADTVACVPAATFLRDARHMVAVIEPDTIDDWRTRSRTAGCRVTAAGGTDIGVNREAVRFYELLREAGWKRSPDPQDAPTEASLRFRMNDVDCLFNVYREAMLGTKAERRVNTDLALRNGETRYQLLVQCMPARPAAPR